MRASSRKKLNSGGADLTFLEYEVRGEGAPPPPPPPKPVVAPARMAYEKLTVVELKDELRTRRLKVSGAKRALVDRLLEFDSLVA